MAMRVGLGVVLCWLLIGSGPAQADSLKVLAYNVWMRPTAVMPADAQRLRVRLLPGSLAGYDALVISELFDGEMRDRLLEGLAAVGYRFVTRRLGKDRVLIKDGGVVIASRWPILLEDQRVFERLCVNTHLCFGETCLLGDCLAQKGVVHAVIEKTGRRYHIFGTHLQSSDRPVARAVRRGQIWTIRAFIDGSRIPAGEPVLIAGDLNIDRLGSAEEYQDALRLLRARPLGELGGLTYSFDPRTNYWAQQGEPQNRGQAIDHVLCSDDHLQPSWSRLETRAVRVGIDLSDHHAAYARLVFPGQAAVARAQVDPGSPRRAPPAECTCHVSPLADLLARLRRQPRCAPPRLASLPAPSVAL